MAEAKFEIGDMVKLNHRDTKAILGQALNGKFQLADRRRARRITRIVYDSKMECNFYYLGTNHKSHKSNVMSTIGFRSYQLEPVIEPNQIGRPRMKRAYHRWQ